MMERKIDKEEIKRKNKIVDETIKKLKNEFVGIDDQIDEIMNNVRTWYLYPQLQTRPLIVSIFGLTGIGKTSVVRKIAKYLDIEKDLVYFNFAEIGEMHSYEIEQTIEDELDNECSNRMFVYDEFQYAATLDESGCEKDNKSGLKPFWELMDSGLLHKRHSFWETRGIFNALNYLVKINSVHPMQIEDGLWVNADECLANFKEYDIAKFAQYLNFDLTHHPKNKNKSKFIRNETDCAPSPMDDEIETEKYNYFIKDSILEKVIEMRDKSQGTLSDKIEAYHNLCGMSFDEITETMADTYNMINKGYDLKFNDSIIFVIANIDEAYTMSFNVNPDMSPDQFHKITKKISIVDIKEALKKRFRNEQIARLGNIHVIYPSFSSDTFRKLIDMSLNEYAESVNELTGFKLVFDNSLKKCIYDEAVYPTHGTRPIFSTIHEIVKSKLPEIVRNIDDNNIEDKVDYIKFSHKDKKTVITAISDNKEIMKLKFNEKLRLNQLRETTKDEQQILCAVHESGHFVVYAALNGKMPEKLVSRTTDSEAGGFLMEDVDESSNIPSFNEVLNKIKVLMGGYIAERLVFGEEFATNGACSDLERATILASQCIREWGFGNHPYVSTYSPNGSPNPSINSKIIRDNDFSIQGAVKSLFNKAYHEATVILKSEEWRKMLIESSEYLSNHSNMPKKKMEEIYSRVDDSVKVCQNNNYYRERLTLFSQETADE